MLNALYNAAAAVDAIQARYEAIAANLANVATPGYRRQFVLVEASDQQGAAAPANAATGTAGPRAETVVYSFEPGPYKFTNSPLDLAILGDGFFVVQSPKGPLYTRNGTFTLDENRQLVTHSGMPVLGQAGQITLPPGTDIVVREDGTVLVDGEEAGQLRVVSFQDKSKLVAAGTTLFQASPEAGLQDVAEPKIKQGYREMSNVNPVSELVNLIVAARQFEAAQRAMHAISQAVAENVNPMSS